MKFVAKPNTWYDAGTEVKILVECGTVYDCDDMHPSLNVLCQGIRNGDIDEEMCCSDEFYIVGDAYFEDKGA